MTDFPDSRISPRLCRAIGAFVLILAAIVIFTAIYRRLEYWKTPELVPIPDAPPVEIQLSSHPRLVADQDAIDALANSPDSPEHRRIIAKAAELYDGYLDDPLQGDTIYPGYFALAYRISGEERYLDAARDMVLNHCKFPEWRRKPESANFYKIELAYAVGLAYDLLYDEFSDAERRKIESGLTDVLKGLVWHIEGNPSKPFWFDAPHSNYYVAQHSAAGLLAICLGETYPDWHRALNFAYDGLEPSIAQIEHDGGWIEGLTYQDFCWGQHALLFLNALRVNNGPNRLADDWFKTSALFALNGILPSGEEQINFGDNIKDPIASWGYLLRAKPFFNSPFLDEYVNRYHPVIDYPDFPLDAILINAILEHDPSLPIGEFEEPEPCQYFPGIEWAVMRENWTNPKSFVLAAKAGYGGWDHNHIDQGTFILAFNGETYITDPGRGNFKDREDPSTNMIFGGPIGHNVFLPDEYIVTGSWDNFSMYNENTEFRQADAAISDWIDNPQVTSFSMDLSGAYPWSQLKSWERQFEWQKPSDGNEGRLIIEDHLDTKGIVQFVTGLRYSEEERLIRGTNGSLLFEFTPAEIQDSPGYVEVSDLEDGSSVIKISNLNGKFTDVIVTLTPHKNME